MQLEGNCVQGCNELWLQLAKEVLENNGIILKSFQQAVIRMGKASQYYDHRASQLW